MAGFTRSYGNLIQTLSDNSIKAVKRKKAKDFYNKFRAKQLKENKAD